MLTRKSNGSVPQTKAAVKEDLEIEEVRTRSDGTVVVEVDEVLDPVRAENFMDEMRSSGDVEYIEPDAIMQPFALNDEFL